MNNYDLLCEAFDSSKILEEGYTDATIAKIIKKTAPQAVKDAKQSYRLFGNMKDAVHTAKFHRDQGLARKLGNLYYDTPITTVGVDNMPTKELRRLTKLGEKRPNYVLKQSWIPRTKTAKERISDALHGDFSRKTGEYDKLTLGRVADAAKNERKHRIMRWRDKKDSLARKAKADELFG